MTFEEYKIEAHKTAIYPVIYIKKFDSIAGKESYIVSSWIYPAMGLLNEYLEYHYELKKTKKLFMDPDYLGFNDPLIINSEIGDVLWYISELCFQLDIEIEFDFPDIAQPLTSTFFLENCFSKLSSLLKKAIRGDYFIYEKKEKIKKLLTHILILLNENYFLYSLDTVAKQNLEKLSKRQKENKLMGDGSHR